MMKQRGDHQVVNEPFGPSAYYSAERIFFFASPVAPREEFRYGRVLGTLLAQAQTGPLFVKDFALHVLPVADEAFLSHFAHSFLIRDPAEAIPSFLSKLPQATVDEIGYEAQHTLFERVSRLLGRPPPVIDADDLLRDPEKVVRAYCAAVNIPFVPKSLSWEPPGDSRDLEWWDGAAWHEHLRTTRGFEAPSAKARRYANLDEDENLKKLYEASLPFYEKLRTYRIAI
jgi:hypothetical protein